MEVGEDSVFLPIFASSMVRGCPVGRRRAGRRKNERGTKKHRPMKKSKWWASLSLALVMSTGLAVAVGQGDKAMQRQSDGTYVVNTVTLCPTVRGFKGATPLFVYIKGGKVVKVEAQRNQESPKFFQKVRQGLLPKFAGMKLSTAAKASEVDGVTGATMSSRAVKKNVAAAVKYYQAHK